MLISEICFHLIITCLTYSFVSDVVLMKLNVLKEHNKKILYIYTIDDQDLNATHSVPLLRLDGVVNFYIALCAIIKKEFIVIL